MVTDQIAYIGTSNWVGDYFTNTAGIGFVSQDTQHNRNESDITLRSQLASIFERDWNSKYAIDQDKLDH
jgi:phospholipase D3/4